MSKLTNAQRESLMERILRETFEARFDALQVRIDVYAAHEVRRKHPAFIAAWEDPLTRPYLAVTQTLSVRLPKDGDDGGAYWRSPDRYAACAAKHYARTGWWAADKDEMHNVSASGAFPAYTSGTLIVTYADLVADYHTLWAELGAAQKALRETVCAYSSRPKFEADFPDLAKYLPPEVGPRTAVAVPVEDLRAKLSAGGIPTAAD